MAQLTVKNKIEKLAQFWLYEAVETLSDPNYSVSQYVYCTVRSILILKLP